MSLSRTQVTSSKRRNLWFEKIAALIALVNLVLVLFNITYVPYRDVYLEAAPQLVEIYDPVKGIRPHPETQYYLQSVNQLEEQVTATGLESLETTELLAEMRSLSTRLIQDDPFALSSRSQVLAKIKNQFISRVNTNSAREAFDIFWSQPYLLQQGWQSEIDFFNTQIRPLIETNYYRELNTFNQFVDQFWIIDLPFVLFFALEIAARTFVISRRRPDLNWEEAILRRWYDLPLMLPAWRWLRFFPVIIRLYQANLLNLEPIRAQFSYDFAMTFAQEMTETMGVQAIDQLQDSIRKGEVIRWLFHPETRRPYVQVNTTNEVNAIANRLVTVSVYDVLPQIQPDIEALLHHNITSTLNQSPIYRQLDRVPGLKQVPDELADSLAKNLSKAVHDSLVNALEDPAGAEITARLTRNFRDALEQELQKTRNMQEIQSWLVDLLEEIKINYVRRIAERELEDVVEEADKLQRLRSPVR